MPLIIYNQIVEIVKNTRTNRVVLGFSDLDLLEALVAKIVPDVTRHCQLFLENESNVELRQ